MNDNYQFIMHNNIETNITNNNDFIIDCLKNGNNTLFKFINNKILNDYDQKVILIQKILKSNHKINYDIQTIKYFFILLTPLNIEYNLGDKSWSFKKYKNHLLVQNCALKINLSPLFYDLYINKIKNILKNSNIYFDYKEYENRRNHKTVDLIFIIKI